MRYSYKNFFHLLIEKDLKKSDLVNDKIVTSNVLSKMTKGESVSLGSLVKIAIYLNCQVGDLIELVKEEETNE